jgi:hypothetical protein
MKRIIRISDVLVSDLAGIVRPLLTLGLVLSGGVSIVAIGLLITYSILLRTHEGIEAFMGVMSFSGAGLVEPVRRAIEVINWISFLALGAFCGREALRYAASIERRSRPNNVVQFPSRKNNSSLLGSGGIVANL